MINTCHHLYDEGGQCNSAAVTDQNYCTYHLRYRARQLRMAQRRARNERFDIKLPPLEDMFAVQSALSPLAEALAADMIDPKRAHALLSVLRLASLNFRNPEKWQTGLYHSDQPAPAIDLAAEYGLPGDLDLDTPPELAFPPPAVGAPPLSPDVGDSVGAVDAFSNLSPMPSAGYCSEHGYDCPDLVIGADHPVTPEMVEVLVVAETLGSDAAALRGKQVERNRQRRQLRTDCKRYAAVAMQKNLRLAAEKLAERKLSEKQAQEKLAAKKPSASVETGETFAAKEADTA
jgi:hypothetical protein